MRNNLRPMPKTLLITGATSGSGEATNLAYLRR